ncbi:MAG: pilus assembly protein [Novosphingobium sp.]|nr:pilus assembly protein [Novosphingobium sp.]
MNRLVRILRALRTRNEGSVVVEFGLLGGLFIGMLVGVLQVGVAMQNYNALRNVASDVARYALVQYQSDNPKTNEELRDWAIARATDAPYLLDQDDLTITVIDAATQRVSDAQELSMTITYQIPTFMDLLDWESPSLTYSRALFVMS